MMYQISWIFLIASIHNIKTSTDIIICHYIYVYWLRIIWVTTTIILEEFEDTKGVIRIRISKKNRQHNGWKKKDKRTNNDLQNITHKTKDRVFHQFINLQDFCLKLITGNLNSFVDCVNTAGMIPLNFYSSVWSKPEASVGGYVYFCLLDGA